MLNWNEKSEKKGEKKISAIRAKALHLELNDPQERKKDNFDSEIFTMDPLNRKP